MASTAEMIVYSIGTGSSSVYYSIAAEAGSAPSNLGSRFDQVSLGHDEKLGLSANGIWAAVDSTRFDCADYACLDVYVWMPVQARRYL